MESLRIDKYLWAVRIFKTRSEAADAIRNNRVTVNGGYAKPSREIKVGDEITVRRTMITYRYRVLATVSNRQPAKNVPLYCEDITPQSERDKLNVPHQTIFVFRDRGTGRPTKKERREMDSVMEDFYNGSDLDGDLDDGDLDGEDFDNEGFEDDFDNGDFDNGDFDNDGKNLDGKFAESGKGR